MEILRYRNLGSNSAGNQLWRASCGRAPIHWDDIQGNVEITQEVIRDKDVANTFSWTPLQIAMTTKIRAIIKALLEYHAKIDMPE